MSEQESSVLCACGHREDDHGEDQEVDADGRPTTPIYLVCFKCLEDDVPVGVWSHDFEAAP